MNIFELMGKPTKLKSVLIMVILAGLGIVVPYYLGAIALSIFGVKTFSTGVCWLIGIGATVFAGVVVKLILSGATLVYDAWWKGRLK